MFTFFVFLKVFYDEKVTLWPYSSCILVFFTTQFKLETYLFFFFSFPSLFICQAVKILAWIFKMMSEFSRWCHRCFECDQKGESMRPYFIHIEPFVQNIWLITTCPLIISLNEMIWLTCSQSDRKWVNNFICCQFNIFSVILP